MRFSVAPGIRSLPLYPVESEEQILRKYNLQRLIKMASNENCYGPSPLVLKAMTKASSLSHRYPEIYAAPIKTVLGEFLNVDPAQIIPGNGSTEVIEMIAKTFLQPNENCLTAHETFPIYRMAVNAANAICKTVPVREDRYDLEGMLKEIDSDTRLIFIANPNNPTGTAVSAETIRSFIERVPSNVIVVIDEAYREYAVEPVDSLPEIARHENLIVLRTFSKIYGLAGLRLGYAVCSPEIASYLSRASFPYAVNLLAQTGAAAALSDQDHVRNCRDKNSMERERMQKELSKLGFSVVPSQTNFILVRVRDPAVICEGLLRKGILVASVSHFHVPDGIRITLGLPHENELLLDTLRIYN